MLTWLHLNKKSCGEWSEKVSVGIIDTRDCCLLTAVDANDQRNVRSGRSIFQRYLQYQQVYTLVKHFYWQRFPSVV